MKKKIWALLVALIVALLIGSPFGFKTKNKISSPTNPQTIRQHSLLNSKGAKVVIPFSANNQKGNLTISITQGKTDYISLLQNYETFVADNPKLYSIYNKKVILLKIDKKKRINTFYQISENGNLAKFENSKLFRTEQAVKKMIPTGLNLGFQLNEVLVSNFTKYKNKTIFSIPDATGIMKTYNLPFEVKLNSGEIDLKLTEQLSSNEPLILKYGYEKTKSTRVAKMGTVTEQSGVINIDIQKTVEAPSASATDSASPISSAKANTYKTCAGPQDQQGTNFCVSIEGTGKDSCSNDADCKNITKDFHKKCYRDTCAKFSGKGENECEELNDCSYLDCARSKPTDDYGFCVRISGSGKDSCKTDRDCYRSHKACSTESFTCIGVPGEAEDECKDDSECFHMECDSNSYCSKAAGKGLDKCTEATSDKDCFHKACDSRGFCAITPGQEKDSCKEHTECSHLACFSDGRCSRVGGIGKDECKSDKNCPPPKGKNPTPAYESPVATATATTYPSPIESVSPDSTATSISTPNESNSPYSAVSETPVEESSSSYSPIESQTESLSRAQLKLSDETPTIEMFQDLRCGMCRYAFLEALKKGINNKQFKVIFKEFPLMGIESDDAKFSVAAKCAEKQGKYLNFIELAYQNFDKIKLKNIKQYASQAGLDSSAFSDCYDNRETLGEVILDIEEGKRLNISGTPAFIINDNLVMGAKDYESLLKLINKEPVKPLN